MSNWGWIGLGAFIGLLILGMAERLLMRMMLQDAEAALGGFRDDER